MSSEILFYGVSSHLGGGERSLLDLIKFYKTSPDAHPIRVLLPKNKGPLNDELRHLHVPIDVIPFPYFWSKLSRQSPMSYFLFFIFGIPGYFCYLCRLYFYFRKKNIKTIHSTGIKCHLTLCLLSSLLSSYIVIHLRDSISSRSLQSIFLKFKDRSNIVWIAASVAISKTFLQMPIHVFYCGFNEKQFFAKRNFFLHDLLKIPHDHRLVGLVGVYARWKGQKQFIQAAGAVLPKLKDHHFLLIGSQIYDTDGEKGFSDELQQLVKTLHLEKNVHFVPFQKNPEIVYNSLDLLVHCSIEPEPFGRVIVEGLLCEVPVLASAAGGVLEIIKDESYGLLHQPGDFNDLANKTLQSLQDPDRLAKAHKACLKIRKDYNFNDRFSLLKNVLEKPEMYI